MADEYISRAEALEITTRTCGDYAAAFAEIRKLPAADVAPVVHGWWKKVRKSRSTWECSACGVKVGAFFVGISQYCYCCGARMGGVAE
jgi:hypothetical protein